MKCVTAGDRDSPASGSTANGVMSQRGDQTKLLATGDRTRRKRLLWRASQTVSQFPDDVRPAVMLPGEWAKCQMCAKSASNATSNRLERRRNVLDGLRGEHFVCRRSVATRPSGSNRRTHVASKCRARETHHVRTGGSSCVSRNLRAARRLPQRNAQRSPNSATSKPRCMLIGFLDCGSLNLAHGDSEKPNFADSCVVGGAQLK